MAWTISESTQAIIQRLNGLDRAMTWFQFRQPQERICALLSDLAATRETAATPFVLPFLFSDSIAVRAAARKAVSQLMAAISPADLLHANEFLGWSSDLHRLEPWNSLSPARISRLASEEGERPCCAILGLTSFHHSGFVRQEAIRLLSEVTDGTELPFLLIRQNDWVRQIASDAQAAVSCRITDAYLPHFINSLPIVLHLKRFQRQNLKETVRRTMTLLLAPQNESTLKTVLESARSDVFREIVCGGLDLQPDHRVLISTGLESPDPVVRLAACRRMTEFYCGDELLSKVEELTCDPFFPVRRVALCAKVKRFPKSAISTWRKALFDCSFSIRELARVSLTQIDPMTNAAGIYRNSRLLAEGFLPAVEGLAETAEECDAVYFQPLITHPWPSRRLAAIRGLDRVLGEAVSGKLFDCLTDTSPSVVRETARLLVAHHPKLAGDRLFRIAVESCQPFSQRAAIDLIVRMGKWKGLPWLIRTAAQSTSQAQGHAIEAILRWFSPAKCNQNFTRPSEDERKGIEEAMTEAMNSLPLPVVSALRHGLRDCDGNVQA